MKLFSSIKLKKKKKRYLSTDINLTLKNSIFVINKKKDKKNLRTIPVMASDDEFSSLFVQLQKENWVYFTHDCGEGEKKPNENQWRPKGPTHTLFWSAVLSCTQLQINVPQSPYINISWNQSEPSMRVLILTNEFLLKREPAKYACRTGVAKLIYNLPCLITKLLFS